MATLTSTGVTFGDGSTVASTSTFLAVGSIAVLSSTSTTCVYPNQTQSGSILYYATSAATGTTYGVTSTLGTHNMSVSNSGNRLNTTLTTNVLYMGPENGGLDNPYNVAAAGGTWRLLSGGFGAAYLSYYNRTHLSTGVYVRIA